MIIYLHELRSAQDLTITLPFQETFPLAPASGRLTSPMVGTLQFQLNQDYLLVHGQLQGTVELQCDRCLQPHAQALAVPIDEAIPLATAGDVPVDKWTLALVEVIGRQETVDVTELARQYTVLAIPPRWLCSPTCKPPLAPTSLSSPASIDPRLRKLAELLPEMPKRSN